MLQFFYFFFLYFRESMRFSTDYSHKWDGFSWMTESESAQSVAGRWHSSCCPGFSSQGRRAFLCGVYMLYPCLGGTNKGHSNSTLQY